jgi:YtkA-like
MAGKRRQCIGVLLAAALLTAPALAAAGPETEFVSQRGIFTASYQSSLEPITINRMHEWVLTVRTMDGVPVDDAEIDVTGGMPAHNHGLPTKPRVVGQDGPGRYRIGGLRFHMQGDWELTITITAGGEHDTVIIPLHI